MILKKSKKRKSCASWLLDKIRWWKENKTEIQHSFWRWTLSSATFTEIIVAGAISLTLCFFAYQAADDLIDTSIKCNTCIIEDQKMRTIKMNEQINQLTKEANK